MKQDRSRPPNNRYYDEYTPPKDDENDHMVNDESANLIIPNASVTPIRRDESQNQLRQPSELSQADQLIKANQREESSTDLIQKEKPKKELAKDPISAQGEHAAPLMAPNQISAANGFADSQEMKEEKKSETMETAKRLN